MYYTYHPLDKTQNQNQKIRPPNAFIWFFVFAFIDVMRWERERVWSFFLMVKKATTTKMNSHAHTRKGPLPVSHSVYCVSKSFFLFLSVPLWCSRGVHTFIQNSTLCSFFDLFNSGYSIDIWYMYKWYICNVGMYVYSYNKLIDNWLGDYNE